MTNITLNIEADSNLLLLEYLSNITMSKQEAIKRLVDYALTLPIETFENILLGRYVEVNLPHKTLDIPHDKSINTTQTPHEYHIDTTQTPHEVSSLAVEYDHTIIHDTLTEDEQFIHDHMYDNDHTI